ncbi:MAG: hypothetical protein A3D28_03790 [Omnitrophica bacterium RIFCSPHIGHO2_02_FULL_63_14]|nr:MAG: hypothetical protein A3D28_03790 [Omnitrophica bacterium RIFCSPHIGHO2_02_FULL_63_14]
MQYAYHQAFLRATKRLSRHHADVLLRVVARFQQAVETGVWPQGLGLTHLRGGYFEFRVDAHVRVIYRRTPGLIEYALYGSHDDVRRFLKTH